MSESAAAAAAGPRYLMLPWECVAAVLVVVASSKARGGVLWRWKWQRWPV